MLIPILFLIGGLVLLVVGSEVLVRGAVRLAFHFGISALVVGLTVVAFGTSAPEFLVSGMAAVRGQADIALGNVLGSNIFNILAILGLSALVVPLTVAYGLLRFDVPVMIASAVLVVVMGWDGRIQVGEGLLLFALLCLYIGLAIWRARRQALLPAELRDLDPTESNRVPMWRNVAEIVGGLVLLGVGSSLFVDGAVDIARQLGFSELVIGLTVVAAGTSLPEIATSIMAAFRGERDIAVGNVVGSNIFNTFGVLGVSAAIGGGVSVPDIALQVDLPVMLGVSLLVLPVFFTGRVVSRGEGFLLTSYYVAYTTWLLLSAGNHPAVGAYQQTMLIAVPAAAVVIFVLDAVLRRIRDGRGQTADA
jgi:cation:H+ antiporter